MAYRDIDTQVRCPYCRAMVGRQCRAPRSTRTLCFTKNPHKARVTAANEKATQESRELDG